MADSQNKSDQIREAFENRIEVECIPPTSASAENDGVQSPVRVAVYCRVSTDSDDQMASYETQIQAYRSYVNGRPDWELVDIYPDPGISGTSLRHRAQFARMIEDCQAGKIDMILTKNISRFARNVVDCVVTARMLKSLTPPVAIFFEDVGINTLTQTGELLLVVLAAIAQGESETKSTSVKWGFRKRFEAGLPKIAPLYGYDKDGRDLYINETEALVVRLIYQMFLDDGSIARICVVLNTQSIPSPLGKLWSYSTVRGILSNEKYCGDVIMQKTVSVDLFTHKSIVNDGRVAKYRVRDHHEPIIEKDMWLLVQERLSRLTPNQYDWDYWTDASVEEGVLSGFSVMKPRGGR